MNSQTPKCVVRVFQKDARLLCKEFEKLDELDVTVTKKQEYTVISLTGSLHLVKMFTSFNSRSKRTIHTYYLYGDDKNEVHSVMSRTCGVRARGCFIPIPQI